MGADHEGPGRDRAPEPPARGLQWTAAFAVHVFTASGAILGFLALLAAIKGQWATMFLLLGVALAVDGVDGTMARWLKVGERLPRWSGDTLDLVVDYITYVFVPAYAIALSGLLPSPVSIPAALAIVITGALYFADRRMKTDDNYFRGFPTLWNAAAFYLFLLRPGPWISAGAVAILAVMTFVPIAFVHPFRVARLRRTTLALLMLGAVLAAVTIWYDMAPGPWVTSALCAIAVYVIALGLTRRST
jgi:phosphatidylcholine synthase